MTGIKGHIFPKGLYYILGADMPEKMSDEHLRWLTLPDNYGSEVGSMARELLTLRQREREARELLKEAAFVFETCRHKRFVWLSEGAEHE
jgi:hypothetical protein